MEQPIPRIAAIHSLAGFGRSSLAVIIPTLSAMGIQVCPIPTTVLSTHTGGLGEVEMRDLTNYIHPCVEHYKRLGLEFSCIYSGFLSNPSQAKEVSEFIQAYPGALAVVDPVMGDHGKPYRTYTAELMEQMRGLVGSADLITPNPTEAYLLLRRSYTPEPLTRQSLRSMLAQLGELGPKYVVITGVELASGGCANVGYAKEQNNFWMVPYDYVPTSYPGTGDIFASVLTGSMLRGDSFPIAMDRATQFVELAIKTTFSYGTDTRYGVMLERCLAWLTQNEVLKNYQLL
ncbi:MAG TPA: pyridoxamine kinase [Candidatus Anaerotruncus excrementipullorum]|uniref:pyridoxal kinase n=1 Tax=Candidatus Anaerotruncus excrementipullorum TaxID=2838465 RepID=A0A9D1WQZ2_9FIRM|nr:pyridoxamine kinase [Candidatus Anaerotruncus excrementipullorum]